MTASDRLSATLRTTLVRRTIGVGDLQVRCVSGGFGKPLVLIHGLNIGWGQWYAVFDELARGFAVSALDLPGAGDASKIDFLDADVSRVVLDSIDAALRAVAPEGATVVAHSLGAWAALKLASQGHPSIKAVVAVSPVGFTRHIPPKFRPLALRAVARFLARTVMSPNRKNIATFLGDVMKDREKMAAEYVDYVVEHVNRPPVTHPFLLIHKMFRPFRFRDEFVLSEAELSSVGVPVLFIHGSSDPLIPLNAVQPAFSSVKGSMEAVLDGVGHVPPIERPAEFARLVSQFASRH